MWNLGFDCFTYYKHHTSSIAGELGHVYTQYCVNDIVKQHEISNLKANLKGNEMRSGC